ncbi:hypothetical protein LZ575_03250 [Antarcticibacterium sp. 1MA-6-2]|uniref:hypothetical protein n=1 Tax=Antarcticibacterium sp. 1MA-6-2 TaxID=2908210 RepID=UPI001F454B2E|nr:hypothetical protein [Antarcticibacterium sp. 1MA-6-2]UJH91716.1 hypothetical protein LZ575_03250 [Antarcticibacterium sp. 1MA-6-2]
MIWIRIKELERRLITNKLSEKTGLHYLLAHIVVALIFIYLPEFSGYTSEWYYFAEFLVVLIILIITLKTAFSINKERDFLKRAISLSFVIGLRLLIFFTLLHLLYKIIMFIIPVDLFVFFNNFTTGDIPNLLFTFIISLSFYFLLTRAFKRINLDQGEFRASNI